jgi:hypothetical protein
MFVLEIFQCLLSLKNLQNHIDAMSYCLSCINDLESSWISGNTAVKIHNSSNDYISTTLLPHIFFS